MQINKQTNNQISSPTRTMDCQTQLHPQMARSAAEVLPQIPCSGWVATDPKLGTSGWAASAPNVGLPEVLKNDRQVRSLTDQIITDKEKMSKSKAVIKLRKNPKSKYNFSVLYLEVYAHYVFSLGLQQSFK